MPLEVKEFDKVCYKTTTLKLGKNQEMILEFLKREHLHSFTQREIQMTTKIEYEAAVNSSLHSLKNKGLVICKEIGGILYWKVHDGVLKSDSRDKRNARRKKTNEQNNNQSNGSQTIANQHT